MNTKQTPAQDYAKRMIDALDGFINNPEDIDWTNDLVMLVFERPKTLRSALSAYLYKAKNVRNIKELYQATFI